MTMEVTETLFPQNIAKQWSLSYDDLIQYGLLILAFLYWLIFLRCGFTRRTHWVQAPDGITAGELGCCLSGVGVDFPMMVLSWAQMGYLTIEFGRNRHIFLQKTMDMGNERSEFEVRTFKTLFGKRSRVDGSSEHFARLGRKAGKSVPGFRHYFKKGTGNPLIFRGIAAGIGAVAGYSLAVAFASDTLWQVLLAILLVPLGAALAWLIQEGAKGVRLRHRLDLHAPSIDHDRRHEEFREFGWELICYIDRKTDIYRAAREDAVELNTDEATLRGVVDSENCEISCMFAGH